MERLNEILHELGISKVKLAKFLGVSRQMIYNYLELAKIYKEQVQLGYSKMLPQIALGHSQSSVIANAHFENEVLKLYEIMIPPIMSSTMNPEVILGQKGA